jgi:SAM-dependent methyltransferase
MNSRRYRVNTGKRMSADFERLIAEAESQPFSGWDFSFLNGRYLEGRFSWDFAQELHGLVQHARSMLDLGTGGGEFLSSLAPLPTTCAATEGFRPNLHVACARLAPIGVGIVCTFCGDNDMEPQRGELPFRDGAFDLVMDRHESFVPKEVARSLRKGGIFVTQQVGEDNNAELREFFGKSSALPKKGKMPWNLARAVRDIESTEMRILQKKGETVSSRFLDVGALTYHLKAIPWEVPGFSPRREMEKLREADRRIRKNGSFNVTSSRFYIQARRE